MSSKFFKVSGGKKKRHIVVIQTGIRGVRVHKSPFAPQFGQFCSAFKLLCLKHSLTVLFFRGFVSGSQYEGPFSGTSCRGMTVYSPECPFSLGFSLGRKVSISRSLFWFERLFEATVRFAWFGPFHLQHKKH